MVSTTATVEKVEKYIDKSDIDDTYDETYVVYVKYRVGNTVYHNKYETALRVKSGSTKKIYYNKNNPNEIVL